MPTTATAMHFGSGRKQRIIYGCADCIFDWSEKAGPAGYHCWWLQMRIVVRGTFISAFGVLLIKVGWYESVRCHVYAAHRTVPVLKSGATLVQFGDFKLRMGSCLGF